MGTVVEEETGLLDLLVAVAENLKLLIFGPLAAGLLALGAGYTIPKSYSSQSILALPLATATQAAALMQSPIVLDQAIDSLNASSVQPIHLTRKDLAGRIRTAVSSKDGLLRLDVGGGSPKEAQTIAIAVIDAWFRSTVPGPQEQVDLEKRLAYVKLALIAVDRLQERLMVELPATLREPTARGDPSTSLVVAGELQGRYFNEVLAIQRTLHGVSRDTVKVPPTLATEPSAPNKSTMAIVDRGDQ